MNRMLLCLLAATLPACAPTDEKDEQSDPIKDFVEVNELESVRRVSTFEQLRQDVLTDYYVLIDNRRGWYLIEYYVRCRNFQDRPVAPDHRSDARALHAGADTFRGCRIRNIYALTEGQAAELQELDLTPVD